jgi:hypothetical protein
MGTTPDNGPAADATSQQAFIDASQRVEDSFGSHERIQREILEHVSPISIPGRSEPWDVLRQTLGSDDTPSSHS